MTEAKDPALLVAEHELHLARKRIEQQQQTIEALARNLKRTASARTATIAPATDEAKRAPPTPDAMPLAPGDGWPSLPMPKTPLPPPPGLGAQSLAGGKTKVVAFAVFGLEGEALEAAVRSVADRQRQAMDFVPVFLTDSPVHDAFRRRAYAFEYFAKEIYPLRNSRSDLEPRLDQASSKWGLASIVNTGEPGGDWFGRDGRPLHQRLRAARAEFAAGRFEPAQRAVRDFTDDSILASRKISVGRPLISPRASVVVVSNKDSRGVGAALQRIASQLRGANIELVLVDNGNARLRSRARKIIASFTIVHSPFDVGCSAGRNLGAHYASAPYVVFLDDDGLIEEGCIEALLSCIVENRAVAVRGRVRPLTSPELGSSHYDLGPSRVPSLITCEGVSAWKRDIFVEAGGFDPLLVGQEGFALCCALWRNHGPMAFLYEPNAILLHDYGADPAEIEAKTERHKVNERYLGHLGLKYQEIRSVSHKLRTDALTSHHSVRHLPIQCPPYRRKQKVSVLTTAKKAANFAVEFSRSWKAQTEHDFELIVVDDHSTDKTAELVATLWKGDRRLKLIRSKGSGRSAALNTALDSASGEICLIADVDDVSIPDRVMRSREFFASRSDCNCMAFLAFNERNPLRLGPPRSPFVDDINVRQLFGTPAPFPAFAFRRKDFQLRFDEALSAGVDCDWIYRNSRSSLMVGKIVPIPVVYYREHDAQITNSLKTLQADVRDRTIRRCFSDILGELDEASDLPYISVLTNTRVATGPEKERIGAWLAWVLESNRLNPVYRPESLEIAFHEGFKEIRVIPASVPEKGSPNTK